MQQSQESALMFSESGKTILSGGPAQMVINLSAGLDGVHGDLEPVAELTEAQHNAQSSASASSTGWLAFLSLDYYQSFFDVTTMQVIDWSSTHD